MSPQQQKHMSSFSLLLIFLLVTVSRAYDTNTCCELAKADQAFVGDVPSFENQTCGQEYHVGLQPARVLEVTFQYCTKKCPGMDLHKWNETTAWTAPLVQFILPSIIFSMTIPRQKKIEVDFLFDFPGLNRFFRPVVSMVFSLFILVPIVIDTFVWISTVVVCAGNMLVGGLYEAHVDYRILRYLKSMVESRNEDGLRVKRELLVTIAAGNLELGEGDPQRRIPRAITLSHSTDAAVGREKARSRLLNLLGAQASFGSAVGSPVLFYLGAFAYSISELYNDPSSQPAAISLGFGIEWMVIVHVAIISGCLLASNNPSTSSGIVGSAHLGLRRMSRRGINPAPTLDVTQRDGGPTAPNQVNIQAPPREPAHTRLKRLFWSPAFATKFQPVSLHARGTNKMRWVRRSIAWNDPQYGSTFVKQMRLTTLGWLLKVWVPCMILIVVPPAAGGLVAYYTPPMGLGCRSLSFTVYAGCQVVIVTISTIHMAIYNLSPRLIEADPDPSQSQTLLLRLKALVRRIIRYLGNLRVVRFLGNVLFQFLWYVFTGNFYKWILRFLYFFSLISAVGGTTMQIVGVYNNCICYAGAASWKKPWNINPTINLASDTELARAASVNWRNMGIVASLFMAANAYLGWWYQKTVRKQFKEVVIGMGGLVSPINGQDDNDSGPDDGGGPGDDDSGGLPRPTSASLTRSSLQSVKLPDTDGKLSSETLRNLGIEAGGDERGRGSTEGLIRGRESQDTNSASDDDGNHAGLSGRQSVTPASIEGRRGVAYGRTSGANIRSNRAPWGRANDTIEEEGLELHPRRSFPREQSDGRTGGQI